MPISRKTTAEGFLTLGLLGTVFWVVRVVFEIIGDAETAKAIAKHSASISHFFASGLETIVGFLFSPLGSSVTVFLAGGYLWIDNRRHKTRATSATRVQETRPLQVVNPVPELPAVIANAQQLPESEERIFIDLTPRQLVEPFRNQVSMQAQKSVQRYIGKWYRVSGSVYEINQYPEFWTIRFFVDELIQIALDCDLTWTERIELLDRGTKIQAIGQIMEVNTQFIRLKHCNWITEPST